MFSYEDIFTTKKRILFVTAHPDDVDFSFAGTIARLKQDKKEVFVVVVTNGARGSQEKKISERTLAATRKQEQINALDGLGVASKNFTTLNYKDGEAENNMELIGKIAFYIRQFKPDLVATHDPQDYYGNYNSRKWYVNHRDHRITGVSTLDAVYPFSRDLSFFPEHARAGAAPHTVLDILLTSFNGNTQLDVTEFIDKKREALSAHKSQFDKKTVDGIIESSKKENRYFEQATYIRLAW